MSEPTAPETPVEKKSGKKKKLIIIIVGVLALVGAGGGVFYIKSAKATPESKGKGAKATRAEKGEDADKESAEEAGADETGKDTKADDQSAGKNSAAKFTLPDDENVKQVIELQPFIVNLADTNEARYLRLTVSIGTGEAEGGEKTDPLFTTRIRNAMLAVLTTKSSADVLTSEGKNTLRQELLRAARSAAKEPTVEAIYITDFIVQL